MTTETVHRHPSVLVISTVAKITGLHPQTLRIYERKGLVLPARTRGGSRRYSQADIETLNRIQELRKSGLNLAGIREVLSLESEIEKLKHEVAAIKAKSRTQKLTLVPYRRSSYLPIP